jgi:hypothetical protein
LAAALHAPGGMELAAVLIILGTLAADRYVRRR